MRRGGQSHREPQDRQRQKGEHRGHHRGQQDDAQQFGADHCSAAVPAHMQDIAHSRFVVHGKYAAQRDHHGDPKEPAGCGIGEEQIPSVHGFRYDGGIACPHIPFTERDIVFFQIGVFVGFLQTGYRIAQQRTDLCLIGFRCAHGFFHGGKQRSVVIQSVLQITAFKHRNLLCDVGSHQILVVCGQALLVFCMDRVIGGTILDVHFHKPLCFSFILPVLRAEKRSVPIQRNAQL